MDARNTDDAGSRISRWLTMVLRHRAHEFDIKLDSEGWVEISALARVSRHTEEDIVEVVAARENPRFEVRGPCWDRQVRATHGRTPLAYKQVNPTEDAATLPYVFVCGAQQGVIDEWSSLAAPTQLYTSIDSVPNTFRYIVEVRVSDLVDAGIGLRVASDAFVAFDDSIPSRLFKRVLERDRAGSARPTWAAHWAV